MDQVIPDVGEEAMLNSIFDKAGAVLFPLSLRLYSNDKTPVNTDTAGDYTQVAGGGYAAVSMVSGDFTVTPGSPSLVEANAFEDFAFTGATNAPGTVYGYYILDNNGVLISAQRFDDPPFTPANGSLIRIKPRMTLASVSND